MNTVKAWFKRAVAEWSPIAGVLDTLLSILVLGIGGSVIGVLRGLADVPWGWTFFISVSVSVAICAAALLWRRSAEQREEATDVLRALAFEVRRITTADEGRQWFSNVALALVGANLSFLLKEWELFVQRAIHPTANESEILQTAKRCSYWLRTIAPTIKALQIKQTSESNAAAVDSAHREYTELLTSASNIVTRVQAQGWARRMSQLVLGLRSLPVQVEFNAIVGPLFGPDQDLDVPAIVREGVEYLTGNPLSH